jgi:hypothetical protein
MEEQSKAHVGRRLEIMSGAVVSVLYHNTAADDLSLLLSLILLF